MFAERPESRVETDKKLKTLEAIAASPNTPRVIGKVALGFAVIRRSVLGVGDQMAEWSYRMKEKSREAEEISKQRLEHTRNQLADVLAEFDAVRIIDKAEYDISIQAYDVLSRTESIIESEAEKIQAEQT